jgi:hypothetical protein
MLREHQALLDEHEDDKAFADDFMKKCKSKLRWAAAAEADKKKRAAQTPASNGTGLADRDWGEIAVKAFYNALSTDVEKVELLIKATSRRNRPRMPSIDAD